jgi:hypothetical protein
MNLPQLKIKFWMEDGDSQAFIRLAQSWWELVRTWLLAAVCEIDPETAPMVLVKLLAWQRDTERLKNEPEEMFRLRIKHALANAKDAGSVIGFENIWERLALGSIRQAERIDAENWDVIQLVITDNAISQKSELMETVIRMYGRTCRRYEFVTEQETALGVRSFDFDFITLNSTATQ